MDEWSRSDKCIYKEQEKMQKLIETADLIVMLDFNQSNRLGEAEEYVIAFNGQKRLLLIIILILRILQI